MVRCLPLLALAALAACSGSSPVVETPSRILLPADTVPGGASNLMYIGDMRGSSINDGNTWVAVAEVTVLDGWGNPVRDVVVSGDWDTGDMRRVSCTTHSDGACDMTSEPLRKRIPRAALEITGLEHRDLDYQPDLDAVDEPEAGPPELIVPKP